MAKGKKTVADNWDQFINWFPEINPKLIDNFEKLESIEIKFGDGSSLCYENEDKS